MSGSSSESKTEPKGLFEAQNEVDDRPDGHILRRFFDDWPRTLQDPDNNGTNASPTKFATCLSIFVPGNSSLDVSLSKRDHHQQPPLNKAMGRWTASNQVASMGGPLAEALRSSSTSNSSLTSVLRQLPKGSTSEISYIST